LSNVGPYIYIHDVKISRLRVNKLPEQCICWLIVYIDYICIHIYITTVCSQIHTKHINTLCGQNAEFPSVKPGGTYRVVTTEL
jgi:hypothetical protein